MSGEMQKSGGEDLRNRQPGRGEETGRKGERPGRKQPQRGRGTGGREHGSICSFVYWMWPLERVQLGLPASLTPEFFRKVSAAMCLPSWTRKAFVLLDRKTVCLARLLACSLVCLIVCWVLEPSWTTGSSWQAVRRDPIKTRATIGRGPRTHQAFCRASCKRMHRSLSRSPAS